MHSWREFWENEADTLGITLFFSALGSAFMLWATDRSNPITKARAISVLVAGQLAGNIASAFVFGYLEWSIFLAPLIGTVAGLVGIFGLLTIIKAGKRVEDRSDDVGDIVIKKMGGRDGEVKP